MDAASGTIEIPDNAITRRLSKNLKQAAAELEITASAEPAEIDREQLEEQLFNAMDEVPEGWMVRSNRCGSSELKALAGFGAIGHQVPEVRFGSNLEIGPGRSEEHTSELQSLMRISYAVFCLTKQKHSSTITN